MIEIPSRWPSQHPPWFEPRSPAWEADNWAIPPPVYYILLPSTLHLLLTNCGIEYLGQHLTSPDQEGVRRSPHNPRLEGQRVREAIQCFKLPPFTPLPIRQHFYPDLLLIVGIMTIADHIWEHMGDDLGFCIDFYNEVLLTSRCLPGVQDVCINLWLSCMVSLWWWWYNP